ncbi:ribonuclease HI [Rubritalea squalenifaciens DSM 18772]|uniref:Ribonuclease H n=1 Tax=Rubritalea squalenifaciens DSM 18772 TaxID=1123071 RepID=A0A1M6EQW3_9BACT|nr:ribonuclease HI [Rubritalea squalenifaciens DSM 18772]
MRHKVTIYTDGSSRGNPGPGGYGVVMMAAGRRKELSGGYKRTTNNRMELMAAIVALEALKQPCEVSLHSDSKYVIDAMTKGWVFGWKAKGWSRGPGKELKNAELWQRLYAASHGHKVDWKWVRGHAGNVHNERCDTLAVAAGRGSGLPEDEGFED